MSGPFLFVPLIFFVVIVATIVYCVRYFAIPSIQEYESRYPECRTNRGYRCFRCNSSSIRNWGLNHANSGLRVHSCNHCGTKLYRTG